jgi:hypothetical protein
VEVAEVVAVAGAASVAKSEKIAMSRPPTRGNVHLQRNDVPFFEAAEDRRSPARRVDPAEIGCLSS